MSDIVKIPKPDEQLCPLCRRKLDYNKVELVDCNEKNPKTGVTRHWTETRIPCTYCECVSVVPSIGEPVIECKWKTLN